MWRAFFVQGSSCNECAPDPPTFLAETLRICNETRFFTPKRAKVAELPPVETLRFRTTRQVT